MRCSLLIALCAAGMVCLGTNQAGEKTKGKDKDDQDKRLAKAVQLGPGVHEFDDKGRIKACWIVGQAKELAVLKLKNELEQQPTHKRVRNKS